MFSSWEIERGYPRMYLLETRPYAETTDAKPDRGFEATLGLYGKNGLLL